MSTSATQTRRSRRGDGRSFLALVCFCVSILGPLGALTEWRSRQIYLDVAKREAGQRATPLNGALKREMAAVALNTACWHLAGTIACVVGTGLLIGLGCWFSRAGLPPEYAAIDWRTTPRPTRTVTVRATRWQWVVLTLFLLLMGGLTLAILTGKNTASTGLYVVGLNGAVFGVVFALFYRARRKGVSCFDAAGVLRRDGRRFAWDDFQGVTTRVSINLQTRRRFIWRTELAWAGGRRAWIIPQRIKNVQEVCDYLDTLPRARLAADLAPIPASAPAIPPPGPTS